KLDRALRWLNDSLNSGNKKQSNVVVNRFVDALKDTVSQGRLIRNAAGNLKEFIDKLTRLSSEWKNAEVEGSSDAKELGEIFDDIKNVVHDYLDFRQEYLLTRKVALLPNALPSEKMLAIFKQAVLDYRIIDFANNDPCVSLSMDLEMDVEYFVAAIKNKILLPFAHNQKDKTFVKINEFTQTIEAYNTYLSNNMRPINDKRMDIYVPLHREDNFEFAWKFQESTVKSRKQLDTIYGELCDGETLFIYSVNDSENDNGSNIPFLRYLVKVKEKYSMVKTLLYSDQPRPFYDFYVCNDIERRIPVPSKFGTSYRTSTIGNVTMKSLSDYSRFVILSGIGGLGKSMMMRHLLLDSLQYYGESGIIPVFIPLKDFDESVNNLFDYAYKKLESLGGGISESQFEDILSKGLCLLLFDGLDEIGTNLGKRFERDLEEFTDKYPDNYFVISSRPYQSFISYSRFTVLKLKPFSKMQAVKLVENLEFRPDEPSIKEKFRYELERRLYQSHREFTENPLLLTIMLMTFEQFAEVPSKMHIFYREAFLALSQKHDASKGAYKRTLKTGLSADKFADYFAELCSRSYHDEKFELTETEFSKYYSVLKEREKAHDDTITA
ncbi:MAG: NACHT domain-containing protein, partial [Erysipelotrichaceae bacterium]|nr:NACHT domain-containing protein [Erysipelotrichaceae bacterium]